MKIQSAPIVAVLALLAGCSRDETRAAPAGAPATNAVTAAPAAGPRESLGNVMVQVARRFEIAGKAGANRRYELAEFEAGEIEELFESDVPGAELPKDGPTAQIPALAKAFLESNAPALRKAAAAKDAKAFADAFGRAAAACNGCHQASAKGFIEVPTVPGKAVPDVDPAQPVAVPASAPAAAPSARHP
jgi:hypothetical protein